MTDLPISPLRRRMIEDMTIRRLSPKTLYPRRQDFATFLGHSPDKASARTSAAPRAPSKR